MPLFIDKSSIVSGKQAQQTHRFILSIRGIDVALIKNVSSPKYKISTTKYDMLEYEFSYPDKVKWESPISFEIVQILDDSIFTTSLGIFISKLINSAYFAGPMGIGSGKRDVFLPDSFYVLKDNIAGLVNGTFNNGYKRKADEGTVLDLSKQKLMSELGRIEIKTLDADGKIYDGWRLEGAFIIGVSPSDLSYDDDKVATIKVELSYDWAQYGFRGVYAEEDAVQRILGI